MQNGKISLETSLFIIKFITNLAYVSAISNKHLPERVENIYPYIHQKTYMQIFIAAFLIIVENQPTCPSARIDKLLHIYVMRCSAIKRTTYDICNIMDKSQKHYTKWKKPNTKRLPTEDFISHDILKKQNFRDRNKMIDS